MLEIISDYPDQVLAIRASGEITAEDYRDILVPAVEKRLAAHQRLRLLYLMDESFSGFTGGAAWEDTKVGMRHFTHFERVAVVTDKDWVKNMVKGFGFALPGEVRVYELDDQAGARRWITEPPSPGEMVFALNEDDAVLVIEPRDELETGDFQRLAEVVDPFIDAHGGLAGLVIVTAHFPGWDNYAALSSHLRFVRGHHRKIGRVALVTESRLLSALPRLASLFIHSELRRFQMHDRDSAMRWAAGIDTPT